ncbi:PAS domain S-box protein [Sporomusa sphaeroides]|uniref:GAF domain-containing sensor histidine kinase n=1 Tax=Sporomusa sphaeroides TaxID=47679 RepID=UPI00315880CE
MGKHWLMLVLSVGLLCIYSLDWIYCDQETRRYAWILDNFTERLERTLQSEVNQHTHAIEAVRRFMLTGEAIPDKETFERFARRLLPFYPEIIELSYSDANYIIRYLYPEGSGLSRIGEDLTDISRSPYFLTATLKAEREQIITVNRLPIVKQAGGDVLEYRAPLFVGDNFRGMVWVTVAPITVLHKAVKKVDPALEHNECMYHVEVGVPDSDPFYMANHLADNSPVREFTLTVADVQWQVKTGWSRVPRPSIYIRGLIWGLGISTLSLLLLLINGLIRRQAWLLQAVDQKTRELLLKNKILELEMQEHRNTEQALRQSEERMATLLAAVPDKLFRVSRAGKILDVEVKKPEDLYMPKAEILNKNIVDVLPAEVWKKFLDAGEKMLTTGEPLTVKYQLAKNNVKKEYESRLAVSEKDEILVIIRDITEQRQDEACERLLTQISAKVLEEASIEDILSYTCEQLAAVFSISFARVSLKTDDGTDKISAVAGRLAKVESGRLRCSEKGRLSRLAIRTGELQVVQHKERLSTWQETLIAESGADKDAIQSEIALPLNLKGSTAGALYLISNIPHYWNERIVARLQRFAGQLAIAVSAAASRQHRRLLIAGLEAAANAIVITDRDGNIVWVNSAFSVLTGYAEDQAYGRNLMPLSGYPDESFYRQFWQQLQTAAEVWRGESAHSRQDGSLYEEVMTITPVRNNQGEIVNFIAIKEDITEQKLAAAAMERANALRAQAEKLSSLGTMAAGLAHEINQPLNSIKMIASGMVYAYNKGKERPVSDLMRNVEEISNQADRINRIIMHMRSFIRQDASQAAYCNLNAAVEQSLRIIGSQLTAHGIQIQTELAEHMLLVYAIPTALEELIVNLASNAMQAMDSAECRDKRLLIQTWADQNTVNLKISDTGPGIPAANRSRLFEPFFSSKQGGDNLGLGLPIVQAIVTSCQGTITVVSKENEGAAFLITLPGSRTEAV